MKTQGKKLAACAVALCLTAALIPGAVFTKASAAQDYDTPSTPTTGTVWSGGKLLNSLYANGSDLTITKEGGKTIAKADGFSQELDSADYEWYVFAGSKENGKNYESVTITIEDGAVNTVVGSNAGSGSIKNSNITVRGGDIGMVIANQGYNSYKSEGVPAVGPSAPSYAQRRDYSVENSHITVIDGQVQAVAGTYGYSYTKNVTMDISGGVFNAATSPVQTGIILGGTNGEVENATLNMRGGVTDGISLAQRTVITGKATLNLTAGKVGNIYAGSRYNAEENSQNSWWGSNAGYVNYGQAKEIELTISKGVVYNDIYAGFQYYPDEVSKFKSAYGANTNNPVIAETYDNAPLTINLYEKPDAAYIPAEMDKDNLSFLKSVALSYVTLRDYTSEAQFPVVDPEEPVEEVTVGVADDAANTVNNSVSSLLEKVRQEGKDAVLPDVENAGDTTKPVAEKLAEAVQGGKTISTEIVVAPLTAENVPQEDGQLIEQAIGENHIAQYLDVSILLKADDQVIGKLTKLQSPVVFHVLIPEEYMQEGNSFYMIRVHDGMSANLIMTQVKDNHYTFVTNCYSTYALAYSQEQSSSSESSSSSSSSSSTEEPEEPSSSSGSVSEPSASSSQNSTSGGEEPSGTPDTSDAGASTMLILMLAGASCVLLGTLAVLQKKHSAKEL